MFIPIPPEIEDRRALVEAINDRLEELDKPLTADRVLIAVPGERNDSRKTVMLDLQSTLFDLIGNTEKTVSLDGDAIFGGDSWDEMTGGGNTTLHKHDIYGELAQDETITGDWTFTDTLLVKSTAADTDAALTVQSLAANAEAMVVIKGIGSATAYGYSALRLQSDEATDHEWRISHDAGGANLLLFGYGTIAGGSSFYSFGTTGVFSCGAVTIGANTLDTNEWAYLDGQDQALKTSDLAVFDKIGINTATVPSGGTAHTSTGLSLNNRYFELLASGIDAYPMVHIDALGHDNIYLLFDAYPKDTGDFWRSSDAGSNFGISKSGDKLNFLYDSAIAAGNAITWNTALSLDTSGNMLVNGTGQTQYGAATEYINGPGSSVLALNAGATISMNAGVEIHHGTVDGGLSIYESDEGNVAFEMLANTNRGIFKMYASGVVTFQFNSAASAAAISYFNTGGHYGFNTTTPDDTLEIVPHAADTGLTVREFDDGNDAIRIRASNTRGTVAVMSNNANTWFFNGGPTSDSYFNPTTGGFIIGGTSTTVAFEVDGTARMTGTGHYEFNDAGTYVYSRADSFLSLVGDGGIELQDQTSGNYTLVETDGTLQCIGDATTWEDVYIGFAGSRVPAANNPTWATFIGNIKRYTFAVNDYLPLSDAEILHSYKEGSNLEFHVHWATNGLEGTDAYVKWEIEYTYANQDPSDGIGDAFPSSTVITAEQLIPANTPDRTNMYTLVGTLIDASVNFGAIVSVRIRRIASVGDAPTADPFGMMIGIHIEQDTMGSRTILTK